MTFKIPAPRFFYFMTYKYDIGLYIVPKHIFEGEDLATFRAFDIANGSAGDHWSLAARPLLAGAEDHRSRARAGGRSIRVWSTRCPEVERIIYLPWTEETQMAQQLISNEVDCSLDLRPLTMETILAQNPASSPTPVREPPYGYVDWWPTSLYVNNEREPYNDPDVRWALSYFIDRDQIIEVALAGAGSTWPLPVPSYPGLQPFIDAVADLLEEYPTLEFNPEKGDGAARRAPGGRRTHGMWTKDGTTLDVPDRSASPVMADIGPVIAEQLQKQGIDASFAHAARLLRSLRAWRLNASLFGHGGSVSNDPYFTLRALPVEVGGGARRPPGQLLPVAQRRVRQDRRRDGRHAAGRPGRR